MNLTLVDPIAQAVLYEGYILYPYRPSVKNRQRWTFGGIYPEAYCQTQRGGERFGHPDASAWLVAKGQRRWMRWFASCT